MRCNEFDAVIEEILAGVLHPDASQHMRECERCSSYFRARTALQSGLRALASAPAHGPSHATDRRVMEAYRRFQQGREAVPPSRMGRVLAFPSRGFTPAAHTRWGGLAVAVALLAIAGSGVHLWTGAPTVTAPSIATAPAVSQSAVAVSEGSEATALAPDNISRQIAPRQLQAKLNRPARIVRQAEAAPVLADDAAAAGKTTDEVAVAQGSPAAANSIMHLASTGGAAHANGVAQSAGSTWPGYNNLMYCDPVVCSGPMQVVNIKVPASQIKPGEGTAAGKSFINVEVLVGPDGVARAIRTAN